MVHGIDPSISAQARPISTFASRCMLYSSPRSPCRGSSTRMQSLVRTRGPGSGVLPKASLVALQPIGTTSPRRRGTASPIIYIFYLFAVHRRLQQPPSMQHGHQGLSQHSGIYPRQARILSFLRPSTRKQSLMELIRVMEICGTTGARTTRLTEEWCI